MWVLCTQRRVIGRNVGGNGEISSPFAPARWAEEIMTTQPTTPKRWRPRFSLRTLVIVVTLVCCYAACWGPTKTRGIEDVREYVGKRHREHMRLTHRVPGSGTMQFRYFQTSGYWPNESVSAPLIVGVNEWSDPRQRKYYFWLFGYVVKLPYERELSRRTFGPSW